MVNMKRKLFNILAIVSTILVLPSCETHSKKHEEVLSLSVSKQIYSGSGHIRVIGSDFVTPFNTSISSNVYYYKGQYTTAELDDIKNTFENDFLYYHALSDRHYDYYYYENDDSEGVKITNIKTINDSYGTGESVIVDKYLFDLLKQSYEFSLNSNGKFNIFLGSLSDIYQDKIDVLQTEEKSDIQKALMLSTDKMFSSFSATEKSEIEKRAKSVPHTREELEGLLTFDEATTSIRFNQYQNDNDIKLKISLGGNAKGYATEAVCDELQSKYSDLSMMGNQSLSTMKKRSLSMMINSGFSSLKAVGERPDGKAWRIRYNNPIYYETIGINRPKINSQEVVVSNQGAFNISTSGYYEQYFYEFEDGEFKRRMHILDSNTGYSNTFFDQVSVYLNDAGLADLYTTALENTSSISEAVELFNTLNNIYGNSDAGLILSYKSEVGNPNKHYDYSLADFDRLSSYNLPILNLKDGAEYTGDYTDVPDNVVSVASKFKPSFQENYVFSSNLYSNASLLDASLLMYPDNVLAVISEL